MEKFKTEMSAHFADLYEGDARALVYGEGAFSAKLMMVGEAPGEQETLQGRPFVGKAGKNLDEFLALSGLRRDEIYITNAVKFRPTKLSPAGRMVNRAPTKEEVKLFLPWLRREIALVRPKCVVTLGNVPLKAICGLNLIIRDVHGRFLETECGLVYPMYHPASLIYNPSLKEAYAKDILALADWFKADA